MTSPLIDLSNTITEAVERSGKAIVAVNARQRFPSSGIHWQPGIVVTANHSLKGDEEISVTLPGGSTRGTTLVGRDPSTDLAVLRIPNELPVADIGDGQSLRIGSLALAVASTENGSSAVSMGVISALAGAWRTWRGGQVDQLIRLDLNLYSGFSGGALVGAEGQVLGMVTAGLSRSTGIALPITTINRVVDQLVQKGRIARGYLGVGMQPVRLPESLKQSLNLTSDGGVILVSLENEGPAARAGAMIGDIFVAFDGETVSDTEDVLALLTPERIDRPIPVAIVRGGTAAILTITIGERPRRER
jgi:serine protease DegQ